MRLFVPALIVTVVSLSPVFAVISEPVVTEAVVNGPPETVWKAWTTKPGLEAWLVGKTEIDLTIGGAWRTNYRKDSNLSDDSTIHHTILAFDPNRMLAFKTTKTPANFPFPEITQTWTVIYFEPTGAGGTRVVAHMNGFQETEQSLKMRAFFEKGNRSEMDKLVQFFANGVPTVLR